MTLTLRRGTAKVALWSVTFVSILQAADAANGVSDGEKASQVLVSPAPDARYKADLLLVVAHPDDELLVATFLAKESLDAHKRVAVVYCTRGESGGNQRGYEQGRSLAAVREMEARRALAMLDISNAWFLTAPDTPAPQGHDVVRSLASWSHGAVLEELVRLVRLTRPAAVLTFLPAVVVGENHEDHQAAGVIATEAFDLAGDPTQFAEQVAYPIDRRGVTALLGGLQPWQPQKLYFFSDADDPNFLAGRGPSYPVTDVSPARHTEYFRLWLAMARMHSTQYENTPAPDDPTPVGFAPPPLHLMLGKSLVGGAPTADVFEGTTDRPIAFLATRGYRPGTVSRPGVEIGLGGAWAFYRDFWRSHEIETAGAVTPNPTVGVGGGDQLAVPLLIRNETPADVEATLQIAAPKGWVAGKTSETLQVRAGDVFPISILLRPARTRSDEDRDLTFTVLVEGTVVASSTLRVHVPGSK